MKNRLRAAAVAAGAGVVMLGMGALSASAVPVSSAVPAGTGGELDNGVTWSTNRPYANAGGGGLTAGTVLTFTFSESVDVSFQIAGLGSTSNGTECVELPAGVEVVSLNNQHRYNPDNRRVCGTSSGSNSGNVRSTFRVVNTDTLTVIGRGRPDLSRGILNVVVTADRDAVLFDDFRQTEPSTPVDIDVLDNDEIPPGTYPVGIASPPSNGSVLVNGDGTITYTPDDGFVGTDTFEYSVTVGDEVYTAVVTVVVPQDIPLVAPGIALAGAGAAGLGLLMRRRRQDG